MNSNGFRKWPQKKVGYAPPHGWRWVAFDASHALRCTHRSGHPHRTFLRHGHFCVLTIVGKYVIPTYVGIARCRDVPPQIPHDDPRLDRSPSPQRPQIHRPAHGAGQGPVTDEPVETRNALGLSPPVLLALLYASPCWVVAAALAFLAPEQLRHPLFARDMEIAYEAERATAQDCAHILRQRKKGLLLFDERSLNVVEK